MASAAAAQHGDVRPEMKKKPPPTSRRKSKWVEELRPWERDRPGRNPAYMHKPKRFFNARRRGALKPSSPRILEQVRVQFRFRFTFVFIELVILACLERKFTHLQANYHQLALLLGCSYSTARKVVQEAIEEKFIVKDSVFDEVPFEGYRGRGGDGDRALDHQQKANAYKPGENLLYAWGNELAWRRYYAGTGPRPPHHTERECPRCGRPPWGLNALCFYCEQGDRGIDLRPAPEMSSDPDPSLHLLKRGRRRRPVDSSAKLGVRRRAKRTKALPSANDGAAPRHLPTFPGVAQYLAHADGVSRPMDRAEEQAAPALVDPSPTDPAGRPELNGAEVLNLSSVPAPQPEACPPPAAGRPAGEVAAGPVAEVPDQAETDVSALHQDVALPDGEYSELAPEGLGGGGAAAGVDVPRLEVAVADAIEWALEHAGPQRPLEPSPAAALREVLAREPAAPPIPIRMERDEPDTVQGVNRPVERGPVSPGEKYSGPRPFCRPGPAGLPPWYIGEFRAAQCHPVEMRDVIERGELWCRLIEHGKTPEEAEEAVRELREAQARRRCTPPRRDRRGRDR